MSDFLNDSNKCSNWSDQLYANTYKFVFMSENIF